MAADHQEVTRPCGVRFVIACDGTWLNSDSGTDEAPSNVVRIARALKHFDDSGKHQTPPTAPIPQIAYYQRGAGTDGDIEDYVYGGFTGSDVAEHVREAYSMLADNFNPETHEELQNGKGAVDEIVLLGFSRGAFTARAIASLISDVGLLTKVGMEDFWGIFADWKDQDIPKHKSEWFHKKFPSITTDVSFTDELYRKTLIDNGMTRWGMKIRAIGVWDTVGALGIPIKWEQKQVKEFSFVNTKVARHVQHAFQALALDEHRNLFTPTLWEQPDGAHNLKKLKQCWFPGVHSNIGGSYTDAGISNITLAWMISQLEDHDGGILAFDHGYLDKVQDWNTEGYIKRKEPIRPWGLGRLYDSASPNSPLTAAQGIDPIVRTPGLYHRIDLSSGKQTSVPLSNTNEYIHRSVRVRIQEGGLGTEEDAPNAMAKVINAGTDAYLKFKAAMGHKAPAVEQVQRGPPGVYCSAALKGYKAGESEGVVYWQGPSRVLPEDELGRTEVRMLQRSMKSAQSNGGGL